MKTITISETSFEREFKALISKLELEFLKEEKETKYSHTLPWTPDDLHRKFIYQVHSFKRALEDQS